MSADATEPESLTRGAYFAAVLTLIAGSAYSIRRSKALYALVTVSVCPFVALWVGLGGRAALLGLLALLVAYPVVAIVGSFVIVGWNAIRPKRRAWVGAETRSFVTARLAPPDFYPDNASARRPGRLEALPLLDRVMRWADDAEQTAYFTASNMKVAQVYIHRYGAEIIGTSWGRPKMRRRPHASPGGTQAPR